MYEELTRIVVAAALSQVEADITIAEQRLREVRRLLAVEEGELSSLRRYRAKPSTHRQYGYPVPDGLILYKLRGYYGLCNKCGWIDVETKYGRATPRLAVSVAAAHTCNTPPTP